MAATSPLERVVVLAVDNSEHSVQAFHFYAEHFYKPEDRLLVVNTPECVLNPSDCSAQGIEEAILETNAKTELVKNKFVSLMSHAMMTGEFVALEDKNPGHAIVRYADSVGAAFIVTGSRGLSKLRRTLLGSVSDYILHHARVPVLICRQKSPANKE